MVIVTSYGKCRRCVQQQNWDALTETAGVLASTPYSVFVERFAASLCGTASQDTLLASRLFSASNVDRALAHAPNIVRDALLPVMRLGHLKSILSVN